MKLIEMQKCPICGLMRCGCKNKSHDQICDVCHQYPCGCNEEQEEVDYNGRKVVVGKHEDQSDSRFDRHELMMGIQHELKFTNGNKRTAKNIAKDHLIQIPDYYSKLNKISFKNFIKENNDWEDSPPTMSLKFLYKAQAAACQEFEVAFKKAIRNVGNNLGEFDSLEDRDDWINYFLRNIPGLVARNRNKTLAEFSYVSCECLLDMFPNLKPKWQEVLAAKQDYEEDGGTYDK